MNDLLYGKWEAFLVWSNLLYEQDRSPEICSMSRICLLHLIQVLPLFPLFPLFAYLSQDIMHNATRFHAGQSRIEPLKFGREAIVLDSQ